MDEKMTGTRVYGEPGYIIVEIDGKKTQHSIARVLRAADIPSLTYVQVQAITALANLTAVLIRTLISRDILDDSFLEDGEYSLESITEALEEMGGDYGDPDISVTE